MIEVMVMASAICSPKFTICSSSSCSVILYPKKSNCQLPICVPQLGVSHFSPWNGLKHLGISIRPISLKLERKGKCRGKGVYASLFGVGAPEALVIGVVALLVFGPKGLAEVARNLGKTLRAFQPTIKELQDVSREFKSSLEREIGLDDISSSMQNTYSSNKTNSISTPSSVASTDDSQTVVDPNGSPSSSQAYSSEEYLKITEEQLKSASQQPKRTSSPEESQFEPQTQPKEAAVATPPIQKPESET